MSNPSAPGERPANEFKETLGIVGDPRKRLVHRELRGLSDIGRESEGAFRQIWREIDLSRRREIVHAMVDLAEDNVDVDFRDAFSACLTDEDANVRETAVAGLWDDDRPRTMRALLAALANDPDDGVRAASALALGRFAHRSSLDELSERDSVALRAALVGAARDLDLSVEVRRRALESAGYFGGADVDEAIATAYASGNAELKASALVAIGHSIDTRWLPVLRTELANPEPMMQYEAARAAGEWGEEAVSLVSLLFPLAEAGDPQIYSAAIWALGQIGGDAALRTLRRLAQGRDADRQEAAQEALGELEFDADSFKLN